MYPQQPAPPSYGNNYDFILNPQKPPKAKLFGGLGGNSFVTKIIFIVGGAVVLMMVLALVVNFFFGSKTNLTTVVSLAQTEQEIIRLSDLNEDVSDQSAKNASVNTSLTTKTHQQEWLTFLSKHRTKVDSKKLALKKDISVDNKLKLAKETSTYDATYVSVMRSELQSYAASLSAAYKGSSNKQERTTLRSQYADVQLLLNQWPASAQ